MLNELASAVRGGKVHPTELVEEALRRIDKLDGRINSVVTSGAEQALELAKRSPRKGTLAGIPFLVKDLARCAGLPTSYGSPFVGTGGPPETVDDTTVTRLRAAGAIPIGKSNTPAYGWTAATFNPVFGATRNPWNLERTPGGSSGGSAAALAAGLVPLATSSDGGGSVRIPASMCGLVGLKPTIGAIGRDGAPRWIDFSTWGASGHTVADVIAEASVYLGPTAGDIRSLPLGAIDMALTRPSRVLYCRTLRGAVEPVIESAARSVATKLEDAGFPVDEIENPIPGAVVDWGIISVCDLAQSLADMRDRWSELDPGLQEMLQLQDFFTVNDYVAARRRSYATCATVDHLLGANTVLITPTANSESWGPEGPLPTVVCGADDPGVCVNTPDFNVTGHPVVNVPIGQDSAGVPFGLQIVAPRWRDGMALALAEVIEQTAPWALVADGYEPFPAP
ncbi:MAG TPA: amidase [Acidimicrobiales bacterium]|nr:amidase [Acidimicrobiales bacterium]